MAEKSQTTQEREIKDLLRHAERQPVKNNALRRDTLRRLIDLAHSPYTNLKIIAAGHLKHFIKDFPDLEDDAINAVYDLCEDQVSEVRIRGYTAIVEVSREQSKWVKRNADVLIQLLQSDEPEEVIVVKRALTQHLDMDPVVTLGVLCDQVIPPEEPMDEEEEGIRDRLRSLVLAFIAGEAKRAIIERHTSNPGSPQEEVFVGGMLKAASKVGPKDVDIIVKDVLLAMAAFKPHSARGKELLDVILERAKSGLKLDLPPGSEKASLEHSRYFLELASFVTVKKRVAHPSHLVRFYYTTLMPKMILLRLTDDARIFVISEVAQTLSASEEGNPTADPSVEDVSVRRQVPDICAALLQCVADEDFAGSRPWRACEVLLRVLSRRKADSNWSLPSYLTATLRSLQSVSERSEEAAKVDGMQEIHSLIRSLLPPPEAPKSKPATPAPAPAPVEAATTTTDVSKSPSGKPGNFASRNDRRIMNVTKRKEEAHGQPSKSGPSTASAAAAPSPGTARPTGPQRDRQHSNGPQGRPPRSSPAAVATPFNGSADEQRLGKRLRKGSGPEAAQAPSLLSRLGFAAPAANTVAPVATRPHQPYVPAKRSLPARADEDPDKDPVVGFSIKGAANASNRPAADNFETKRSTLLERMQNDDGSRKKRKTRP